MSMAEKIRILLIKKGNISEAELARRLNKSPQSFNSSMKRDDFTEKDLQEIAKVLDCEYKSTFIIKETGEEI